MKPKLPSILLLTLLFLYASLSHGARPFLSESSTVNRYEQRNDEMDLDPLEEVEVCGNISKEECMMRRTLVAHTDYIYTQGNQN